MLKVRPDLNVALKLTNPRIKNEVTSMIIQYLEDHGYFASALNLRDELRVKLSIDSAKHRLLLKLRVAIKSGDWDQIEQITTELKSSPKLIYAVLRHRFFELISTGETTSALQFLATRLSEYKKYENPPNDFEFLCRILVDASSPSHSQVIPEITESLNRIISQIDIELSNTDDPIMEKQLPKARLLHLLNLAVKFQIDDFDIKSPIKTLITDFQPSAIPSKSSQSRAVHQGNVKCLSFVSGTSTLISGSSDKRALVWSVFKEFQNVGELKGHKGRIWSVSTGNDLAVTACSDGVVRLYNVPNTSLIGEFHGHKGDVYSVATDFTCQHIISGGYDRSIIIWDAATQTPETTLKGHAGAVTSVLLDKTGNTVVSGGPDMTVQLWDVRSYLTIMQMTPVLGEVTSLHSNPSFTRILASTNDSTNRIWDLRNPTKALLLKGHQNSSKHFVRSRFGPDEDIVLGGSEDGKIYSWNSHTGKLIDTIQASDKAVYDVVWSTHAHLFASCGDEPTIRLWEPKFHKISDN